MLNFFPAGDGETLSEIQSGRRDHEYQVSNSNQPGFQIRIPMNPSFFTDPDQDFQNLKNISKIDTNP